MAQTRTHGPDPLIGVDPGLVASTRDSGFTFADGSGPLTCCLHVVSI